MTMTMDQLLRMTNDKLWATREKAFLNLSQMVLHNNNHTDVSHLVATPTLAVQFVHCLADHMVDHHHRVAKAAMEACIACLESSDDNNNNVLLSKTMGQYMQVLLPAMAHQQSNSLKPMLNGVAERCIDSVCARHDVSALVTTVLNVLATESAEKVKLCLLELLARLIPEASSNGNDNSGDFFADAANTRMFLLRMAGVLTLRPTDRLKKAVDCILYAVFEMDESMFVAQLFDLPRDRYLILEREISGSSTCQLISERITAHYNGGSSSAVEDDDEEEDDEEVSVASPALNHHTATADMSARQRSSSPPSIMSSTDVFTVEAPTTHSPKANAANFEEESAENVMPQLQKHTKHSSSNARVTKSPFAPIEDVVSSSTSKNSNVNNSDATDVHDDDAVLKTPNRKTKVQTPETAPMTDPVIRYMARPPVSEEKALLKDGSSAESSIVCILGNLSMESQDQDKYLGMQSLVRLAKEGNDAMWKKHFGQVLFCLLEGVGRPEHGVMVEQLTTTPEKSKDDAHTSISEFGNKGSVRHLYLQGIRALIRFQPDYFLEFMEIVVDRLLILTKDTSNEEVCHTAEKALESLVQVLEPVKYFEKLVSAVNRTGADDIVLSGLRTLTKLVPSVPESNLKSNLPLLMPCVIKAICHSSLVLRKAAVFVIVEMYFVLGESLLHHLGQLNAAQMKLVTIYIERNEKAKKLQSSNNSPTAETVSAIN